MAGVSNVTLVTSLADFVATAHADLAPGTPQLSEASGAEGEPPVLLLPGEKPRPQHIISHQDLLVVGDWGAGTIFFIHLAERRVTGKIDLDKYEAVKPGGERKIRSHVPGSFVVAGKKLFLAQVFSDYVLAVDLPTHSIVKRIPIPGGGEGSLTATADGDYVFASNKSNALYEINANTYSVTKFAYPAGGRGSMSIALSPDEEAVYVGVQRGYTSDDAGLPSGGCFLSKFDRSSRAFSDSVPLHDVNSGAADSSIPACILPDPDSNRIYIGLFQGRRGVVVVEPDPLKIVNSFSHGPNEHNQHFDWVDPLAMKFHLGRILAIFRNNRACGHGPRSLEVNDRTFLEMPPTGRKTDHPR